jgi:hypothetical protein
VTHYAWGWVGTGKRGHAFALAENGEIRDFRRAVCGVGPGYFEVRRDPQPHCKRCERLVPILAHVQRVLS